MTEKVTAEDLYNGDRDSHGNAHGDFQNQIPNSEASTSNPVNFAPRNNLPTYQESETALGTALQPTLLATVPSDLHPHRPNPLPMVCDSQPQRMMITHSTAVDTNSPVVATQQPSIVTVITQPGPIIHQPVYDAAPLLAADMSPYYSDQPRPFSSGIFNCCMDCQSCFCGTFCPCCYLAALASKLKESTLTGLCCMAGLVPLRTKLRLQHYIHGSICDDVCLGSTCCCCVLCQMGREMKMLNYPTKCCCC